jgi:C1A family cysteine protease
MKDIGEALKEFGVCRDSTMPYVEGDYKTAPSDIAKQEALAYKIAGASMVQGIDGIKTALVSQNQPVLVGMTVYESMESDRVARTGVLPVPKAWEPALGGHAVAIVGYLPALPDGAREKLHPFLIGRIAEKAGKHTCLKKIIKKVINIFFREKASGYFIVRNSWGKDWGDGGYFYMPYEYVTRGFADEFWILENLTAPSGGAE